MPSSSFGPGSYQPLSGKERWNLYLRDALWSPGVVFRAAGLIREFAPELRRMFTRK